jgi:hypothetical protein
MIVFDLECRESRHRFEGWFGSSEDFTRQQERGLVACPECGNADVVKAPMAPSVGVKGNRRDVAQRPRPMASGIPPEVVEVMHKLAQMQADALRSSQWVGDRFAEESRAIHYGESELGTIHGQATVEEAKALLDEGIAIAPLPFPVAPPDEIN